MSENYEEMRLRFTSHDNQQRARRKYSKNYTINTVFKSTFFFSGLSLLYRHPTTLPSLANVFPHPLSSPRFPDSLKRLSSLLCRSHSSCISVWGYKREEIFACYGKKCATKTKIQNGRALLPFFFFLLSRFISFT